MKYMKVADLGTGTTIARLVSKRVIFDYMTGIRLLPLLTIFDVRCTSRFWGFNMLT